MTVVYTLDNGWPDRRQWLGRQLSICNGRMIPPRSSWLQAKFLMTDGTCHPPQGSFLLAIKKNNPTKNAISLHKSVRHVVRVWSICVVILMVFGLLFQNDSSISAWWTAWCGGNGLEDNLVSAMEGWLLPDCHGCKPTFWWLMACSTLPEEVTCQPLCLTESSMWRQWLGSIQNKGMALAISQQ